MRTPEDWIDTPKHLKMTRALINVKNWSGRSSLVCCIMRGLFPAKNGQPQRYSSDLWKKEKMYNWGEDSMPISERIDFIESHNDISLNVFYESEEKKIIPQRLTKKMKNRHVNLFWLNENHFCLISSMSRLFSKQNKHSHKTFYCIFCMKKSVNEKLIEDHEKICCLI